MITDAEAAYIEKVKDERSEARGEAWRAKVLLDRVRQVVADDARSADDRLLRLAELLA